MPYNLQENETCHVNTATTYIDIALMVHHKHSINGSSQLLYENYAKI